MLQERVERGLFTRQWVVGGATGYSPQRRLRSLPLAQQGPLLEQSSRSMVG